MANALPVTTGVRAGGQRRRSTMLREFLRSTPWVSPSAILIALVIVVPVAIMVKSSFSDIDPSGVSHGFAGFDNFARLFA